MAWRLDPRRTTQVLGYVAGLLVALHVWVHVMHHRFVHVDFLLRGLLDLDREQALGTWFGAVLLLGASLASLACSERPTGRKESRGWRWLSVGFLLLSIDEVAGLHERWNTATEHSWAVPGAVLVATIGLFSLPFLARLPRWTAVGLVVAGAIYSGGAIGVELVSEPMASTGGMQTLGYALWTALEEGLEMAGVILYLALALRHAARLGADPSS